MAQTAVCIESAVQQIAKHAQLSPKLAFLLLLALLTKGGHVLIRLASPVDTEPRLIDEAVHILITEAKAILTRLYNRETLICPVLDSALEAAVVTPASLDTQDEYMGLPRSATLSEPAHVPQALVLPYLERALPSAQIALLEATRDGYLAKCRPTNDEEPGSGEAKSANYAVPDNFLFVAVVTTDADWGGLFRHLADRVALSCTFSLHDVGSLVGGTEQEFRAIVRMSSFAPLGIHDTREQPIDPLLPSLPPLVSPLRTYISDLLSALRMHDKAPRSLLTARAQRFLPEMVARRAALAGHEPSPTDVRFLLEAACGHRLPWATAHEAIEDVISVV